MIFVVTAVSGLLAFFQPFSILVVGLHALMGFVFIGLIFGHVKQNFRGMRRSFKSRYVIGSLLVTILLVTLFLKRPKPIRMIQGLSHNVGAALNRFEMRDNGMLYNYTPAPNYKLQLDVRAGERYDTAAPPEIAIWLENQSAYHIKTLHSSQSAEELPFWSWKVEEYEAAKLEWEEVQEAGEEEFHAVAGATPNSSFDPADYILPDRNTEPFYMLIEVNKADDPNEFHEDQPSVIYKVEIDNQFPKAFQVLDIVGYSKYDPDEEAWYAYYPDGTLTSSLKLIDSALLTIER